MADFVAAREREFGTDARAQLTAFAERAGQYAAGSG
jgi:hypothetical protein